MEFHCGHGKKVQGFRFQAQFDIIRKKVCFFFLKIIFLIFLIFILIVVSLKNRKMIESTSWYSEIVLTYTRIQLILDSYTILSDTSVEYTPV